MRRLALLLLLASCEVDDLSPPSGSLSQDECVKQGGTNVVRNGETFCDYPTRDWAATSAHVSADDAGAHD